jgi:hypothetical protein
MKTSIIKITLVLLVSLLGISQGLGQYKGNLYLGVQLGYTFGQSKP